MSEAEDILDLVTLSDDDDSEVELVGEICSDTENATESLSETDDDSMPSPAFPPLRRARGRGRPPSKRWARGRKRKGLSPSPQRLFLSAVQLLPPQPALLQGAAAQLPSTVPVPDCPLRYPVRAVPPPALWSDDVETKPPTPTFIGTPRISVNCNNEPVTPLDIFKEYADKDFFHKIKHETNLYARQKRQNADSVSKHSFLNQWTDVTISEIKLFFCITLYMGIVKKPTIAQYWSSDPIYKESFCPSLMSRTRFQLIFAMLHFNDGEKYIPFGQDGHDPLYRIRPIFSHLLEKFSAVFYPEQDISLDEGTCFRVYNPAKPHISGIKLYELHEAKTGYCFNFKLHTGQERQQSHCKTFDLVMSLMANYLDKGHSLYMGRYFSSPKLYDALFTRLTTATGTCMVNRKDLPQVFIKQKLKRGGAISCRKSNLMALKWRDKRDVLMLSTIHNNERSDVSVYTPGGRRLKSKPVVVQDYNKNMVGVDHHDQMMAYYGFSKKSMKWYKKLFFHLISITTVNAHIVYNKVRLQHGNPKVTLLQFIEELVKELAMETTNKIGQKEQATSSTLQGPAGRLMGRHFISRQPGDHHKSCVVCNQKSRYNRVAKKIKYKRSSFWCERCGVTLCKVPCFEEYHSIVEYWK